MEAIKQLSTLKIRQLTLYPIRGVDEFESRLSVIESLRQNKMKTLYDAQKTPNTKRAVATRRNLTNAALVSSL